jgi:putative ABC transport system permease protein
MGFGTVGLLAARGIGAALSRTGMAVAALSLALAATVGMGIMIDSFRMTVADWLQQTLQGDLYVSIPDRDSERAATPLPAMIAADLRAIPGVRELSLGRSIQVETAAGAVNLLAIEMASVSYRGFRFKGATVPHLWRRFHDGEVILVSEPYAFHHRLETGDELELLTATGLKGFTVGGIFFDYGTGRGMLVVDRGVYSSLWRDPAVAAIGIYLQSDAVAEGVSTAIRQSLGGLDPRIKVRANREIQQQSLQIFDRTFIITRVLRLLVILVAFVGILSAFMALQLERRREYALLRATGLTPGQQLKLIGLQTGVLGLMAGLLSLPLGWIMSELLIKVINMRAFGWTLQRLVSFEVLLEALLLALAAALLAGVYPAVKLMRATPAAALRDE